MNSKKEMVEILQIFERIKLNPYVVLIGSWAEVFYEEILDGYHSNLRTQDIDFYYPEVSKPRNKIEFLSEVKKHNFMYKENIGSHDSDGKSMLFKLDGNLEIEFLTKLQRNQDSIRKIESIGINAECLSNLDIYDSTYFMHHSEKHNVNVNIPTPESYVLQKLLINHTRKEDKQKKDIRAIIELIPFVDKEELICSFNKLSKKQKKIIFDTCEKSQIKLI